MRKTYIVTSWKANMPNLASAKKFFDDLASYELKQNHEVIVCPSHVFMETASAMIPKTLKLGAQDVSQYSNGPYTGEITASVLASFGVKYCIVGHIERRALGDTDTITNKKINRLLENGITPIITVGDTAEEYSSNQTSQVIERQLKTALNGVKQYDKLIFCYQPAWSIGTGQFCSIPYTNMIIEFMRKTIQKITGMPMSGNAPILYGGGVTLNNAPDYLGSPEIDGIMIGLGMTNPKNFTDLVNTHYIREKK